MRNSKKIQILSFLALAMVYCGDSQNPVVVPPDGSEADSPAIESQVSDLGGAACFNNETYNVGRGIYDITGPAAELGMMGYAMMEQKTAGIQMRLRSRAFVFQSPCNNKRLVFVSADLGQVFQAVKQGVMQKLRAAYGETYSDANVILSATHTHSGPGGYSHYALYNLTILGHDKQNYNAIVEGIYQSIVRAHNNLRPATLKINSGELATASFNRSESAFLQNPATERALYNNKTTDQTMTLLKIQSTTGMELGQINWFAVHATNVGNQNHLITGDNKGYASYLFEKAKGTGYTSADTFVAAFAQSNEGDVSPNLWGVPDNVNDYARSETIGKRQYDRAASLYSTATTPVSGGVDYRHSYVNFADVTVDARWNGTATRKTCRAAIGVSMIAGSTEDGPGVSFVNEGMVYDGVSWPYFTLMPADQACHGKKIMLLPTGAMSPYPWTPEVLPVQIGVVGKLAIVAVPFECTTMCGRRLRKVVLDRLYGSGVDYAVIAGLANAYAGYVATPEEYAVQQYEGASTHFGPDTLPALQQEFDRVAGDMAASRASTAGPTPRNLSGAQTSLITGVVFDDVPLFKNFGDVYSNAASSYSRGATAAVTFWGGHPKNNLKTQSTYLEVQRLSGSTWITVASDTDPETRYEWKRDGVANSKVTIRWKIPTNATTGSYRIRHYGHWKSGWTGSISSYTGTSRTFSVN